MLPGEALLRDKSIKTGPKAAIICFQPWPIYGLSDTALQTHYLDFEFWHDLNMNSDVRGATFVLAWLLQQSGELSQIFAG